MIAILAYGSLIDDPGTKLGVVDRVSVMTPFGIEYARSSRKRGGGPTLVPVDNGWKVSAWLLALAPGTTVEEAKNMLWRRETGSNTGKYNPPKAPTINTVLIDELDGFSGFETVLSTRLAPNISPVTADTLADLAIKSARDPNVPEIENGISYLHRTRAAGVKTRLSDDYVAAILAKLEASTLEHALQCIRQA